MAARCSLVYQMCEFARRELISSVPRRGHCVMAGRFFTSGREERAAEGKLPLNAPRRVAMRAERRSLIYQMCCSMRRMGDAFRARRLRCGMAGRRSLASRGEERAAKGGFSSKELRRAADGRGRENLKDFARRQGFRRKRFGRRLALSPRAKKRRCDQPAATRCASERRL